jgi:formylglycine-generating enzyme required for sulfatase activity
MFRNLNPTVDAMFGRFIAVAMLVLCLGCSSSTDSKSLQGTSNVVEDFTNSIGMKFVKIPAGEFVMGHEGSPDELVKRCPGSKRNWFNGVPAHKVHISHPFAIGMHEVTRGQFAKFVEATSYRTECESNGEGGCHIEKLAFSQSPDFSWRTPGFKQDDDHPVVQVTWNDANAFVEWLSETEGKTYRLPTEAEWEYVCKAGSKNLYQISDNSSSLSKVGNVADSVFEKRYPNMTAIGCTDNVLHTCPVGMFQPNDFRVFDMHGNVAEFCADFFGDYSNEEVNNPVGPDVGEEVCVRGGGWNGDAETCLSAFRYQLSPSMRASVLGFRVVLELSEANESINDARPTTAE